MFVIVAVLYFLDLFVRSATLRSTRTGISMDTVRIYSRSEKQETRGFGDVAPSSSFSASHRLSFSPRSHLCSIAHFRFVSSTILTLLSVFPVSILSQQNLKECPSSPKSTPAIARTRKLSQTRRLSSRVAYCLMKGTSTVFLKVQGDMLCSCLVHLRFVTRISL